MSAWSYVLIAALVLIGFAAMALVFHRIGSDMGRIVGDAIVNSKRDDS